MNLRDVLGLRPKADTAAALRSALAETQTALATVRGIASALEAERGAILLDASPDEAEAHERKLAEATAEAGRLAAMAAALPTRIADAEARERGAELDSLAEQAEADSMAGAALLPRIIADLAAVAELMRQHDALVFKLDEANRVLRAGGREHVPVPMRRLWPDPNNRAPTVFGFDKAAFGPSVFSPPPPNSIGAGTVARWLHAMAAKV